jgi:hypothetical protein
MQYSQSKACYMPYIDYMSAPIGEEGSSGGDQNGSSGEQNGQSAQSEQSGGGSSGGGQSEQSNQGGEYSCTRTAMFKDGEFAGVLDEKQAFALNLLRNDIRHAFIECKADGVNYALGIRSCSGNIKLSFDGDTPVLTVSFNGFAQLQDQDGEQSVKRDAKKVVSSNYLSGGEDVLKGYFNSLIDQMRATNCDVLGVNKLLYRFNYSRYNAHHSTLLASMSVRYNITLSSAA